MLEAVVAAGAVVALAVASRPGARHLAGPAAVAAAGLSLAVSTAALLGSGRTRGGLSVVESLALLGLVFLALRRVPPPRGVAAAVLAAAAALLIIPSHVTASDTVDANLAGMAVWGCGALLAAGAARYLVALDARRARSVAEARRDQRLSLARDLHDFVAHDVSAMVVQAQAARVVGERDPGEAVAALERIERSGLHALAAMDRAVAALGEAAAEPEPPAGARLGDLRELTARFGPPAVELEVDEHAVAGVPPDVDTTAYRLVTEGLTNVRRHAPGARRVCVRVASARLRGAPALAVTVSNDAGGAPDASAGRERRNGGFGLDALRERVEALGGTLRAGPQAGDAWRLSAVLPVGEPEDGP